MAAQNGRHPFSLPLFFFQRAKKAGACSQDESIVPQGKMDSSRENKQRTTFLKKEFAGEGSLKFFRKFTGEEDLPLSLAHAAQTNAHTSSS
jgi:hypothetical protein